MRIYLILLLLPAMVYSDCPHGFNLHLQNSCYMIVKQPLDWSSADRYCAEHSADAHLAKIESAPEQEYITTYVRAHQSEIGDQLWLDGTDKEVQGHWVWDHDYSDVVYTNWRPSPKEPNNQGGNEHCMEYGKVYGYHWNDFPCNNKLQFICEVEMTHA